MILSVKLELSRAHTPHALQPLEHNIASIEVELGAICTLSMRSRVKSAHGMGAVGKPQACRTKKYNL